MIRQSRRTRLLAGALAATAGYVDAVGYLSLGGFFVSFMSGNSTRLGAGLAAGSVNAAIAFALIATFVAGVALGASVATRASRSAILWLVATLLAVAAACGTFGFATSSVAAATLAMGAVNSTFSRDGDLPVGLTYMTGTLVKLGQSLARRGGIAASATYAAHWLFLIAGATLGAAMHGAIGLPALWLAAASIAGLALLRTERAEGA